MRLRVLLVISAMVGAVLAARPASAQTEGPASIAADDLGYQRQPQPTLAPRQGGGSAGGGIGIGVKGGALFSSFRSAAANYQDTTGWQFGLFLGGNRPGALGLQTELTYAKKGAEASSSPSTTDTYYLEIPLLIRMNIGSSNRNKGVIVYFIGGPAADILLKAQLNGIDIKSQFKDVDWNVLGGGGIEISRLLVEARFNWGLQNVLQGPGTDLKTQSFAVLGGIRFN